MGTRSIGASLPDGSDTAFEVAGQIRVGIHAAGSGGPIRTCLGRERPPQFAPVRGRAMLTIR